MNGWLRWLALAVAFTLTAACSTTYQSREQGFRPPALMADLQQVGGAQVAAEAYADQRAAKAAFGFDIIGAGLLPVQLVFDHQGPERFEIVTEQTFLVDGQGAYWNLLDRRTAYARVEGSSEYGSIVKGGAESGLWGAAGGALLGAAVGILSGQNVGEAAGKGAALGGAVGAVYGGAKAGTEDDTGRQIARDLANKGLENRLIEPGNLTRGFLFYPAEAPGAAQLRLQLRDVTSGKLYTVLMAL